MATENLSITQIFSQVVLYAGFMAVLGVFSNSPGFQRTGEDTAVIRLSFSHGGVRKGGCVRFTTQEIAALPASERRPMDCGRERVPVHVELYVDDVLVYAAALQPSGIARDGPSIVYERFEVDTGKHNILVKMRDSEREEGYDYQRETSVVLTSLESLVIDFRAETGGFVFL